MLFFLISSKLTTYGVGANFSSSVCLPVESPNSVPAIFIFIVLSPSSETLISSLPKPYITCITNLLLSPSNLAFIKALNSLLLLEPKSRQIFLPLAIALLTSAIMVDSAADLDTKTQPTLVTPIAGDKIFKEATWPKGDLGKSKYK